MAVREEEAKLRKNLANIKHKLLVFSGKGGTHPIPLKYLDSHQKLSFWTKTNMDEIASDLMEEDRKIMEAYN